MGKQAGVVHMLKTPHNNIRCILLNLRFGIVPLTAMWITFFLFGLNPLHASLTVYKPVPGLSASEHYTIRVRELRPNSEWNNVFVFLTACKSLNAKTDNYFQNLAGWTHSYVNFETDLAVEVEIARVDGRRIGKATVHPLRKAKSYAIREGKAYIVLEKPCLVAIDIDGQMDDQDTGKTPKGTYTGPPIHTVSIFANPPLEGKPLADDPDVHAVKPGEVPPSNGNWKTLYFLPGVHDIGIAFPVHAGRRYYIPGDAIVYGTFNNAGDWKDGSDIRIFGMGTLSGERITHPKFVTPKLSEKQWNRYRPIEITGAANTRVEGITIAESAFHSLMLISGYDPEKPTDTRWVKIFTWRANGDGINPFDNGLIEDCFIRTQDDSLYVNGRGIRRVVLWNDNNGSSFVLSAMPNLSNRTLVVEDCDVIYARAGWDKWGGGRVFNMRGEGGGASGANVIFRNINIEDPRPTLQQFFINMTTHPPYWKETAARKPGDLAGLLFQNVTIAAPSILGEPEMLWGMQDGMIRDITFDNCSVGGKKILTADFFQKNEFVGQLNFR